MTILTHPTAFGRLLIEARLEVEDAISVESRNARWYGGHKHEGSQHPMLAQPLPNGWRKKP